MRHSNLPCADCGINTADINGQWELYMVTDDTWQAAGPPPATLNTYTGDVDLFGYVRAPPAAYFLCIGCLEVRLGRTLVAGDFTACPVNNPSKPHTARLHARLTGETGETPQ